MCSKQKLQPNTKIDTRLNVVVTELRAGWAFTYKPGTTEAFTETVSKARAVNVRRKQN
jgi:hypothetical protein